ncbi:MAG: tRNA (adenosine(37)-N6)-threonylcarbamoyltransferase complex transferase subunit TsaD [Actinomycetota bacterium]
MIVLGIETSCDETGVGIIADGITKANVIRSQIDMHARFGGVVPEIASREHVVALQPAIEQALLDASMSVRDLDGVAATTGPGLAGALMTGVAAGKALALALDVPFIGVNHLDGHIEAAFLHEPSLEPPLIALLVSGGHTMIVLSRARGSFEVLGSTMDDAAGEAFDKVARFMGLGFPGGPIIDRLAAEGDPRAIAFPRALRDESYDFSYSGLKTAVIRWLREQQVRGNDVEPADVAASFQEAIVDTLVDKTVRAARDRGVPSIIAAGGVAANSRLRARLKSAGEAAGARVVIPPLSLCTDNGAMIAAAGARRLTLGERTPLDAGADPASKLA